MSAPLSAKHRAAKAQALRRAESAARGISHSFTNPAPVAEHLRFLLGLDFSMSAVASARGRSAMTVYNIVHGLSGRMRGNVAHEWLQVTPQQIFRSAEDHHLVPAFAAIRRYEALQWMGHRQAEINAAGLAATGIVPRPCLLTGTIQIGAGRHRSMAAAFDALSMDRGPSHRTRTMAINKGWLAPLAWENIDEPDEAKALGLCAESPTEGFDALAVELAVSGQAVELNATERRAVAHELTARGVGSDEIAKRIGVSARTVVRWRATTDAEASPQECAA